MYFRESCRTNCAEIKNHTSIHEKALFSKSVIFVICSLILISSYVSPYFYQGQVKYYSDNNFDTLPNKSSADSNLITAWIYYTGSDISGTPTLADINNDSNLEVIVGSEDNKLYVLNAENGSLLWSYTTGYQLYSSPVVADINNDSILEIIVGSRDNKLYVLSGKNGSLIWSYNTAAQIDSTPAIGDIDNDGKPEILFGSYDHRIYALNGEDGSLEWNIGTDRWIASSPVLGDIDDDGKLEAIIGGVDNKTYAINANEPSLLWSHITGGPIYSSPVLGDIDEDIKLEVIIGSDDGNIYALNGENGSLLWSYLTNDKIRSTPALGDIDGDGKLEVIVGSDDNNVYALNGEDGSLLWSFRTNGQVRSSPAVGDINGDNKLDVIIGSSDGNVYLLNGKDGKLIDKFGFSQSVQASPTLGDIDGDGNLEIIVGSDDNSIIAIDFSQQHDSGYRIYWNGFGQTFMHLRNIWGFDPDMDMLSNHSESIARTNPENHDSDGDGIPDGWEIHYGLNATNSNDASHDEDSDRLSAIQEFQHSTDPFNNDTDHDGLSDGQEVNIYDTNPCSNDTDSDGMPDGWEIQYSLDPLTNDAADDMDSDGVSNYLEYEYDIDPTNADTDGDGVPDGWELSHNLAPDTASALDLMMYLFVGIPIVPTALFGIISITLIWRHKLNSRTQQGIEVLKSKGFITRTDAKRIGTSWTRLKRSGIAESFGDTLILHEKISEYLEPIYKEISEKGIANIKELGTKLQVSEDARIALVRKALKMLQEKSNIIISDNYVYTQEFLKQLLNKLKSDSNSKIIKLQNWLNEYGIDSKDFDILRQYLIESGVKIDPNNYIATDNAIKETIAKLVEKVNREETIIKPDLPQEIFDAMPDDIIIADKYLYTRKFVSDMIQQQAMTNPIINISQLSTSLGIPTDVLKSIINSEISKGILSGKLVGEQFISTKAKVTPAYAGVEGETTIRLPGYTFMGVLGSGGFATVFRAEDKDGNKVAVKILDLKSKDEKKAAIREISLWKPLEHENIVRLLDYGLDPQPYLVMELMDGTVKDKMKQGLDNSEILKIGLSIARALEYAHREFALVHRDIKPQNILYKGDVYKLSDWGLANISSLASRSGFQGTVMYAAPEQFDKSIGGVSSWTDVWQLGAVLYELYTGQPPFGTSFTEILNNIYKLKDDKELEKPAEIPTPIWEIISAALRYNPKQRITIKEFVAKIEALIKN